MVLASIGALIAVTSGAPSADPTSYRFEGNLVFHEDVYLAFLTQSHTATAAEDASAVAGVLEDFLHRAGYPLAEVRAVTDGGGVTLRIDEGQLERIILPRENGLVALAVQIAIDLPHSVFNRPLFERQLRRLEEEYGIATARYELVPVTRNEPSRIDLQVLGPIAPAVGRQPARWTLRIELLHEERQGGPRLSLAYRSPAGLLLGGGYLFRDFLVADDELTLEAHMGLRILDVVRAGSQGRQVLSRGFVSVGWNSPPFVGGPLRLHLEPSVYVENRQRLDLGITSYDFVIVDGAAGLRTDVFQGIDFLLNAGVQYQRVISDLSEIEGPPRSDPAGGFRPYLGMSLDLDVSETPDVLRASERHNLSVDARWFMTRGFGGGDIKYRKSFAFGWDRLDLGVRATGIAGGVPFTDEVSAGDHLIGVFGAEAFSTRLVSLHLEYRFALTRDLLAIGVFHGGVLFAELDRVRNVNEFAAANAFGPGLHALFLDTFELSLYGAIGFMSKGRRELAMALAVRQVF